MEKSSIINGNHTLAVANDDGVSRSLEPISEYTPIRVSEINKGVAYLFSLGDVLHQDYAANLATFDFKSDDDDQLTKFDDQTKPKQVARVLIKTVKDGVTTSQKQLILWSTQSNIPLIVFRPQDKIWLQSESDLNSLTFYARPILLSSTINLTKDPSFKADTQPASN